MAGLAQPPTAAHAVWVSRGLWLLALISLGLPWLWLEVDHLKSIYPGNGLNWPLLIAVLLVSGFIQGLMVLAIRYQTLEMEER